MTENNHSPQKKSNSLLSGYSCKSQHSEDTFEKELEKEIEGRKFDLNWYKEYVEKYCNKPLEEIKTSDFFKEFGVNDEENIITIVSFLIAIQQSWKIKRAKAKLEGYKKAKEEFMKKIEEFFEENKFLNGELIKDMLKSEVLK